MNAGYHHDRGTGYGRFGYELHTALRRAGVADLGPVGVNEEFGADATTGIAPVAFYAATPPHVVGWIEGQLSALFTMWEFSEMPVGFRANVPDFGRIFVPSLQNLDLFSAFNNDVRYIPLAVGSEWHYEQRTDPNATGRFNFLTGGAGPRKGCNDVIRAFDRVFRDWTPSWGPEPHLTVRAASVFKADVDAGPAAIGRVVHLPDEIGGPKRVTYLRKSLSAKAELQLYREAHCFVSGSKGEGWGFMPHQAIAQGIPTILGDHSGHHAFAHYGIPIDSPLADPEIHTHWGGGGQEWKPDFDEMCAMMEQVYRSHESEFRYAADQSERIAEEFSWSKTAALVIENLPELGNPDLSPDGEWHTMPQRLYEVRVKQHSTWAVNGIHHTYDPGHTYWIPWADKLRIAELGDLTPDCIDPREVGIDARMQPPDTSHERCHWCNQRFGSDTSTHPENLVGAR
jgi:glycosyltransferase involved in cell wall biosynthesis